MESVESIVELIIIIYVLIMIDTMMTNFKKGYDSQKKRIEFQNYQINLLKKKVETWKNKYETDMVEINEQMCGEFVMCNERISKLEEICEKYKQYQKRVIIDDSTEDEMPLSDTESEDEIVCMGCLEHQPNQEAHMGPGGCMDIDIDEF